MYLNDKLKINQWIRVLIILTFYFAVMEFGFLREPIYEVLRFFIGTGVMSLETANNSMMLAIYVWITVPGVILVWFKLRSSAKTLNKVWYWIFIGWFLATITAMVSGMVVHLFTSDTATNQAGINELLKAAPLLGIIPIIFGGPIIEEIIFRYSLQDVLFGKAFDGIFHSLFKVNVDSKAYRIVKSSVTIFLASMLFGLIHVIAEGDYIYLISYGAAGIAFGAIYEISNKNLLVSIGMHMLYNVTSIWISFLLGVF